MKNAHSAILMTVLLSVALLLASCAASSPGSPGRGASSAPVAGMDRPAAGTTHDTLKGCLARIPSNSSAGQRMFAEASCRRDATARQAIEAVPGK